MPYIYIITTVESKYPSKIGIANNTESRLSSLQTGNWEELCIYTSMEHHQNALIEQEVKSALKDLQIRGEWFKVTAAQMRRTLMYFYDLYPNIPTPRPIVPKYAPQPESKQRDEQVLEELHFYMDSEYRKTKRPIESKYIYQFLSYRTPDIYYLLALAVKRQLIIKMGNDAWMPRPKLMHGIE
jgi:hypothetical protein